MTLKILLGLLIAVLLILVLSSNPILARPFGNALILYTATSTPVPISPTASPTPSAGFATRPAGSYLILTQESSCYKGPGSSYHLVTVIGSGAEVAVIGRNEGNTWWRIVTDHAADCWVANESGTFYGEVEVIPITASEYATEIPKTLLPTKAVSTSKITRTALPASTASLETLPPPSGTVESITTSTPLPANNTLPPSTSTAVPPTSTVRPITNTLSPATNTPWTSIVTVPPFTSTPQLATSTLSPLTNTPRPSIIDTLSAPTGMPRPLTSTLNSPTRTDLPATNAPLPPTNTPIPPATNTNPPTNLLPTDPPATDLPTQLPIVTP